MRKVEDAEGKGGAERLGRWQRGRGLHPIATKAKASAMTALSTASARVRFHIIEGATTRHCAASVKAEATRRGTLQCQNEEMRLSRVEGSGKRKH